MTFKFKIFNIIALMVISFFVFSCSTTRVLQENQYQLKNNKVEILNKHSNLNASSLKKYIRQDANSGFLFGWNPMVSFYNWSGKDGKSWISRMIRKIGTPPVVFDEELVDASVENIKNHLKNIGYYNSDVTADIIKKDKNVIVVYNVTLGKQYKIIKISYVLPKEGSFESEFYRDTSKSLVKRGTYLSVDNLEKESARSALYFRQLGYYGFNKNYYSFFADTVSNKRGAILREVINNYTRNEDQSMAEPLHKYKFGSVNVYLPKSTKFRKSVIENLTHIYPGLQYSEKVVNNTYNRFAAIKYFSSVNIELTKKPNYVVDCDISIAQAKLQGFKVGLDGSINTNGLYGITPSLTYYNKNLFRGGEIFNLGFSGNFQFKPNTSQQSRELGITAGLVLPQFLFLPDKIFTGQVPKTEIKMSYTYQSRPEYIRNLISTSFGYIFRYKQSAVQIYPIQFNVIRLRHVDKDFYKSFENNPFIKNAYQNHFDLGSGAIFYMTNATNFVDPYYSVRVQFDIAGNSLSLFKRFMKKNDLGAGMLLGSPFAQYVRGEISLAKSWCFDYYNHQSLVAHFVIGAGLAYGNSKVLPFEKHFFVGGSNSLRGWHPRTVGPGTAKKDAIFVIPNQTGDMKIEANLEYRFHMFSIVNGALFIDAGNVWNYAERKLSMESSQDGVFSFKNFLPSIAMDTGFGLRFDLSVVLIRTDFGFKVYDPSRDIGQRWVSPTKWLKGDNWAFNFGVGYPF